ncbi:MAG: hypothetical protein EB059_01065 [Alphaproteobacteria bacterium]|nr:hypothetical protein [Alphaproteobacteria bacterium]
MYETSFWEGTGAALISVFLGVAFTYFLSTRSEKRRLSSYKSSLRAEIDLCKIMSEEYNKQDAPQAPSWRMPTHAWTNSYPELLSLGVMTQEQVTALNEIYVEINALNLGLDQINDARLIARGAGNIMQEEADRNKLKASKIISRHQKALDALSSIK